MCRLADVFRLRTCAVGGRGRMTVQVTENKSDRVLWRGVTLNED
jgi:hypothetical protein